MTDYDYSRVGLIAPQKLDSTNRVEYYDKYASERISRLEAEIKFLQGYKIELAKRYGELVTMPYHTRISLTREHSFKSGGKSCIVYYLRFHRVYEDGTEAEYNYKRYEGGDRQKAIADYREAIASDRNAIGIMDISKRSWEK